MDNCEVLLSMIGAWASVAAAATNWLFFLRVRAVYLKSIYITALFGTIWLVAQVLLVLSSAGNPSG